MGTSHLLLPALLDRGLVGKLVALKMPHRETEGQTALLQEPGALTTNQTSQLVNSGDSPLPGLGYS